MTTAAFLDQFLGPLTDALSPEVARRIVDLRASAETQARVALLAEKANRGTLSAEEDAEYKSFVDAVDIISILQSKARMYLARREP